MDTKEHLNPGERTILVREAHSGGLVAGLIFGLTLVYLSIFRHVTAFEPDEGIILQGAQRILNGQVLYRDFFSFYTPGSYYLLALMFKVFGSSLAVARISLAFIGAALAALTYLLSLRFSSPAIALTMAALSAFTALPYRFLVLHNWDSTLWACLAVYASVRLFESERLKWGLAAGSFLSITILSEQSKGAGLCIGLGIALVVIFLGNGKRLPLGPKHWMAIAAGLTWPFLMTAAYFASQHALGNMWQGWIWPLGHYSQANRVPYGYQNWSEATRNSLFHEGPLWIRVLQILAISPCFWIPFLPILAVGIFCAWILRLRKADALSLNAIRSLVVSGAIVGLWISVVGVRADIIHFMYLQPMNCVLLAWVFKSENGERWNKWVRPAIASYVFVSLILLGLIPLIGVGAARNQVLTRRGLVTTAGKDSVVEYVQSYVPAGTDLLVYPYLPLYNYVTATFSPSRYDYFQPGMHTREQAQEIAAALRSNQVPYVLLEPDFANKLRTAWPGTPPAAATDDPVKNYLAQEYRACAKLSSPQGWDFHFMVPRGAACP